MVPLIFVIIGAIWLAAASVVENIRFGRSADQIIDLVSTVRNFAAREQNFASYQGENILASLAHAGLITTAGTESKTATMINPWNGIITVTAPRPSMMRIETAVPARNCRRLATFFLKDVRGMWVQVMEARQDGQDLWRRFYDRQSMHVPRDEDVEAACSQGNNVVLALVLGVR